MPKFYTLFTLSVRPGSPGIYPTPPSGGSTDILRGPKEHLGPPLQVYIRHYRRGIAKFICIIRLFQAAFIYLYLTFYKQEMMMFCYERQL
jgi:hypothetical protein